MLRTAWSGSDRQAYILQQSFDYRLNNFLKRSIASTVFSETGTRGSDYLNMFQKIIKAAPGIHAVRALEPDVRGIDTAEETDAQFGQRVCDRLCIFPVTVNVLLAFPDSLLGEHQFCTLLYNIGGSVELRTLAAVPHGIQGHHSAC